MIHDLKILPEYFSAILSGDKTFEVRSVKDRTFQMGDELKLREWLAGTGYTGRELAVKVTYVLPGIIYKDDEAVVMSIFLLKDKMDEAVRPIGDFRDDIIRRG